MCLSACREFASFRGSSHKPASNYILTFCFYHSEFEGSQKGEELRNTHGSSHKHFLTFTWFCNTNKIDMPSSEGPWIRACRWLQLLSKCFAHSVISGFNTDFAGCCNHSPSYKTHKHPSGRPQWGLKSHRFPWDSPHQHPWKWRLFQQSGGWMRFCFLQLFT